MKRQNKKFYENANSTIIDLYTKESTVKEIAAITGISGQTIRNHLKSANVYNPKRDAVDIVSIKLAHLVEQGYRPYRIMSNAEKQLYKNYMMHKSMLGVNRDFRGVTVNTLKMIKDEFSEELNSPYLEKETTMKIASEITKAAIWKMKNDGFKYKDIWSIANVKDQTAAKVIKRCKTDSAYRTYLENLYKESFTKETMAEPDEICSDAQKITYAQMVAERQKLNKPLRNHIITRDNSICQICGKPVSGSDLHIDHITPISKGGLTEESNLQVLCAACNIKKSNN